MNMSWIHLTSSQPISIEGQYGEAVIRSRFQIHECRTLQRIYAGGPWSGSETPIRNIIIT